MAIPSSKQYLFNQELKQFLKRGNKTEIKYIIGNNEFNIVLKNQIFDEEKYNNHADVFQVRYSPKSEIAEYFRDIFSESYREFLEIRKGKTGKQNVRMPEYRKEYILIYSTRFKNTFSIECVPVDQIAGFNSYLNETNISEEEYELTLNYNKTDPDAGIWLKELIVKQRKLNRSIGESLKNLYDYKCQICGTGFKERYDIKISEAHHIDAFVQSLNNDADNIIILCPNHHRVIHEVNPLFVREYKIFQYQNGLKEQLLINKHL